MYVARQIVLRLILVIQVVIEIVLGIIVLSVMAFFMYMGAHIIDEEKKGKHIPLPWEKKK